MVPLRDLGLYTTAAGIQANRRISESRITAFDLGVVSGKGRVGPLDWSLFDPNRPGHLRDAGMTDPSPAGAAGRSPIGLPVVELITATTYGDIQLCFRPGYPEIDLHPEHRWASVAAADID